MFLKKRFYDGIIEFNLNQTVESLKERIEERKLILEHQTVSIY